MATQLKTVEGILEEADARRSVPGLELLRTPFPASHISKLPKETGAQAKQRKAAIDAGNWPAKCKVCDGYHHERAVHLDYVGHAALTDRLLDADPYWTWTPLATAAEGLPVFDKDGGLWIELTVCGITRLGYGNADGKTGGNAIKEAIGDALRNAAMRFGAALDLWHKGDLHADDEPPKVPPKAAAAAPKAEPQAETQITDDQIAVIKDLAPTAGMTVEQIVAAYKLETILDLSTKQGAAAIKSLEKRIRTSRPSIEDILDDAVIY